MLQLFKMALKQIIYNNKSFNISYEIINQSCKNTIIFLHGWGSNKEIMKQAFCQYLPNLQHIYIDMPGFGNSSNDYILTTKNYSDIIQKFIDQTFLTNNIKTIVGHSFGGKIATLLHPKILVLLSSAGIIETKSTKTLLTIRMAKIFNRFGLGKINKLLRSKDVNKMSENMYETFKNVVDEDFSKSFQEYAGDTLIFWGKEDNATTLSSGYTIHKLINNSKFKAYNGDHYFFLKFAKDIVRYIE
ncbi:2-hydroxy-6-oxohepta-2,4-dienoate hydrolase [hydrothermal vent metagenome]|uniref:2-hydroxy-6-oxohepta-2,4-dienoate hydrolase n=1 Tax=hydrothermal vent metagenome TaxID=652676 RepID=A0A3B1E9D8_9ZZZZ